LHVRLVFDDTFNQDAQEAWRQAQVQDRVGGFVGITAIVLGSLAGLFGLLKLTGRKKTKSQGGSDGR